LVGNIAGVHDARIEYFLLTGNFDSAIRQVEFARRERNINPTDQARLDRKEAEIHEIRRQMKEDF
jgi:predicted Zn-dependent protease